MFDRTIQNVQPLVVCLHGSASSHRQWRSLEASLGPVVRTISPKLIGYNGIPFTQGNQLHLDDEADNVIRQVELMTGKTNGPLHIVGHSYGGAVSLQLALRYPERVASLTLYEPAQFLMLLNDGLKSKAAREIRKVAVDIVSRTGTPWARWRAAGIFIDYWNGVGAWKSIPLKRRYRFSTMVPKVAAEFRAIVSAGVTAEDFAALDIPVRLIYGSKTRRTAKEVTEVLAKVIPGAERVEVPGLGHMAPCTHADVINPVFSEHVHAQVPTSPQPGAQGATIRALKTVFGY